MDFGAKHFGGQIFAFLTPKMGIFDFPNIQIVVMGDPQMTFGAKWKSSTNHTVRYKQSWKEKKKKKKVT